MLIELGILIGGVGIGLFIGWVLTRPEPKKESEIEICQAYGETPKEFGDRLYKASEELDDAINGKGIKKKKKVKKK